MRQIMKPEGWVVYSATVPHRVEPVNAVCKQVEWEAMERAKPGQHQLIRAGIAHEGEAERLARGTRGDPKNRFTIEQVEEIE
jgi:hypothetical protein